MRGQLLAAGADEAVVDKPLGAQTPGLLWRQGSRMCAIEIRTAAVTAGQAAERTARLRAVGCSEVLWLCAPGTWVDVLPALGIDDFAPAGTDYTAIEGALKVDPVSGAAGGRDPWRLREFIDMWVRGECAWGYRDENSGGWAMVTDWERFTRAQAATIAEQKQEIVNQRVALAMARTATRDKARQVDRANHRLARAQAVNDELDDTKRELADHHRVDNNLRLKIELLQRANRNWQLMTFFAMFLLVALLMASVLLH
ncbi:hypothetical protein [Nocardia stercoris]|uniref:Uncharacterized protein n=1 Tax=Nocardia stercoris TaxID=2483361 RepID=A0A3M2KWY0_9NOCA|nr:hypothetical protein [Nocardia stercoris]RMI30057.1 hypothetical protein EBN03_22755 [Nocardia stercoris]